MRWIDDDIPLPLLPHPTNQADGNQLFLSELQIRVEVFQLNITYTNIGTHLSLKNEYGVVENVIIFIIAKSGYGKGILAEALLEEFHRKGYTILILADPKRKMESAFTMFPPEAKYHLDQLRVIGKRPEAKNIKLYHPFTFNLPKRLLPEMNLFTLSLKEINHEVWGMLAETESETESVSLLKEASRNISNDDGIYGYLHYLESKILGKRDKKEVKRDWGSFGLKVTSGTAKSLQDIKRYFLPFKKDYFLARHNSSTNLDWIDILNDQKNYHFFFTKWVEDAKMRSFVILALLSRMLDLIATREHDLKHPILIYIPEIKFLTPVKPEGFERYLARGILKNFSLIRSQGRGMSAIFDTQVWKDVDSGVSNIATDTILGELGGMGDIESVSKALNLRREERDKLLRQDSRNTFMWVKEKDCADAVRCWFPSHMHCEPEYSFIEMYRKYYPEKMRHYNDMFEAKEKELKEEESKFRDKSKKAEQEKKAQELELQKERETKKEVNVKASRKIERATDIETKTKIEQGKMFSEMLMSGKSYRDIAEQFKVDHHTVKKRVEMYEKSLEKTKEEEHLSQIGQNLSN